MKSAAFLYSFRLATSPALGVPQTLAERRPMSIVVMDGKLLDVDKATYVENAAVWIEGNRIKEAGAFSEIQLHASKDAKFIDPDFK
jgi:hypothetical protein